MSGERDPHDQHVETEVKIRVDSLDAISARVTAAGGKLTAARIYEKNVRYDDAVNSLTPAGRVLRLRQDTRVRLTYKEPRAMSAPHDAEVASRTELEITVSDFTVADLLLGKLGFHPSWIYEKYRTTYTLDGCEIVLDELPFGNYIELEGSAEDIARALEHLGLADAPRITASYSELFSELKQRLNLAFRDLTFENFSTVDRDPGRRP